MAENETPSHFDFAETIKRMEPGVAPVPIEMSLASIAISMKNISTTLDNIHNELTIHSQHLSGINAYTSNLARLPTIR